jgi:hypothetical protein
MRKNIFLRAFIEKSRNLIVQIILNINGEILASSTPAYRAFESNII